MDKEEEIAKLQKQIEELKSRIEDDAGKHRTIA